MTAGPFESLKIPGGHLPGVLPEPLLRMNLLTGKLIPLAEEVVASVRLRGGVSQAEVYGTPREVTGF